MWSRLTRGGTLGVQCIQHKGTLSFANIVSTHGLVSKFVDKLWAVVNFQGLAMGLREKQKKKPMKKKMTEIYDVLTKTKTKQGLFNFHDEEAELLLFFLINITKISSMYLEGCTLFF